LSNEEDYILKIENISKLFPGVLALDNVDFNLKRGEIHALVGENGAGKSTLIKIISGVYKPEKGKIILDGKEKVFNNPDEAITSGISTIYQEFNLIRHMTIGENIYLGKEIFISKRLGILDRKKMQNETKKLLDSINLLVSPKETVNSLGIAKQQLVSIAKAIFSNAKIIIMDEPSAVLTLKELDYVMELINELKNKGVAIIYISHRIEEIFKIADRVTVLRNGKLVDTKNVNEVSFDELIKMMVGRTLKDFFHKYKVKLGDEILKVENINRKNILKNIDFNLRKGEILGITGLVGAGKTELARAIFGADKIDSGTIKLKNEIVKINSPKNAVKKKLAYLPEDRKTDGLVLQLSVKANITLSNLDEITNLGVIDLKSEKEIARTFKGKMSIKTPDVERKVLYLSGGNQQKIVIAKWLYSAADVFIFDEPTRGIDVGAKVEVYDLMGELVKRGAGIILISSEFEEVLGLCDRILVMSKGKIAKEFCIEDAEKEGILKAAVSK